MFFWPSSQNHRGETIMETVIALTLITMAVSAGVMLIVSALNITKGGRDRIIATNLSRECVEAMRSIRDSNWLIYSNRKRLCWNHNRFLDPLADCEKDPVTGVTKTPINPGYYRIDLLPSDLSAPDYNWRLENEENIGAADPADWANDQLYLENGIYTHRPRTAAAENIKTSFARRLSISYPDGAADNPAENNRMQVVCEVKYPDGPREKIITLETTLTDYWGRTGHGE